ncbi:MAG: peptidoglycan recognition protein family protein, partial [Angustibacter sp.]
KRAVAEPKVTALTPELPSPAGIAIVGVSWPAAGSAAPAFELRTRSAGRWGAWQRLTDESDHAPNLGTTEAAAARHGTDPYIVSAAELIQVRARAADPPAGTLVSIDDPGSRAEDRVGSAAKTAAPGQPPIYSRASWGADESLRDSEVEYGTVQAGFVHHSAGSNSYTPDQVPAIIRGIYSYHVNGRGWRDIGYNYLADKYGRIWEGRYGGIDRPVIGAHTLGFNDHAFAMSALGNYDVTGPSSALLDAYSRLFAWKLALHGVPPVGSVNISGTMLQRINGHSDAGSTACPGKYLYAALPDIRRATLARTGSPVRDSMPRSLNSGTSPDVISTPVANNGAALIGEFTREPVTSPVNIATGWAGVDLVTATPDFTGDGRPDVLAREPTGRMRIYSGT